jgi:translocator protein
MIMDAQRGPLRTRRTPSWAALLGFVVVAEAAGAIGSFFTDTSPGSWYDSLEKPAFTPPPWVFAPVWIVLYACIGVAAWLVWRSDATPIRQAALTWWWVQLIWNALWTPAFFGAERASLAFVIIIALLVTASIAAVRMAHVRRAAGRLMLPYIAWVCFAAALNAAILVQN